MYAGTIWDWGTFLGTIGLFLTLLFLFVRVLPMISIFEMRELVAETEREAEAHSSQHSEPEASGDISGNASGNA
jgi:molybdopterin-containing oxidoreductase family membrane subunit